MNKNVEWWNILYYCCVIIFYKLKYFFLEGGWGFKIFEKLLEFKR